MMPILAYILESNNSKASSFKLGSFLYFSSLYFLIIRYPSLSDSLLNSFKRVCYYTVESLAKRFSLARRLFSKFYP